MTREEAIQLIDEIASSYYPCGKKDALEMAIKALEQEPCYNPDEWCHDCSEYNQDKHCCPRYNKVIRNAVEEMKQPKTGHWIPSHIPESILDECSECGFSCGAFTFNYCPNCGCRMVKPQESKDKE